MGRNLSADAGGSRPGRAPFYGSGRGFGCLLYRAVFSADKPVPVETTTTLPASEAEEILNLSDLIKSIKQASDEEKFTILNVAFNKLKEEIVNLTGINFSEILEQLKDAILERIGTSLALFDISRTSREVNKNHNKFQPNELEKYKDRIDNWTKRIVKT